MVKQYICNMLVYHYTNMLHFLCQSFFGERMESCKDFDCVPALAQINSVADSNADARCSRGIGVRTDVFIWYAAEVLAAYHTTLHTKNDVVYHVEKGLAALPLEAASPFP